MNGTGRRASGQVEAMLLAAPPLFAWDGARPPDAIWTTTRKVSVRPFEQSVIKLSWPLPQKEGSYALAAVWRAEGQAPVHSQRTIHALTPPAEKALASVQVAIFDPDDALARWLAAGGAAAVALAGAKLAVLGPEAHRLASLRDTAPALRRWIEDGGTLVVLEQSRWTWPELVPADVVTLGRRSGMPAVFKKDRPEHPMWRGVTDEMLRRWNGLPGAVARHTIKTDEKHDALAVGTDETEFPKHEAVAEIPLARGRVIFCQMKLLDHAWRGQPNFDPVAERILINLLKQ